MPKTIRHDICLPNWIVTYTAIEVIISSNSVLLEAIYDMLVIKDEYLPICQGDSRELGPSGNNV